MANNAYIFEHYDSLGIRSLTDDGSGEDWMVISGHYLPGYGFGGRIFLNYIPNQPGATGAWMEVKTENPLRYRSLTVYGEIEHAIGGSGTDGIWGSDKGNILQGDPTETSGSDDSILGFGGDDILYGMGGNDTLAGGTGNDRLYGDHDPDSDPGANINSGDDWLRGEDGDDILFGGLGNNSLDGGGGFDTVNYGLFQPDFMGSYSVICNLETDRTEVYWLDAYDGTSHLVATDEIYLVEHVIGTAGDDVIKGKDNFSYGLPGHNTLRGGAGNDRITGGRWADVLEGGDGDDVLEDGYNGEFETTGLRDEMRGGRGNDTYVVTMAAALLVEQAGEGRDTVHLDPSLTHFLLPDHVEDGLLLAGAWQSGLGGNDLANRLTGNESANRLDGVSGKDVLRGLGGDDVLTGGAGADTLQGGDGRDLLDGGSGNDIVDGGRGADRLFGGTGRDTMSGGPGRDTFVFTGIADSRAGSGRDVITDFAVGQDLIDLGAVDGNAVQHRRQSFVFIDGDAFSGLPGQLRFAAGILEGDVDGDRIADFQIELQGVTLLTRDSLIL